MRELYPIFKLLLKTKYLLENHCFPIETFFIRYTISKLSSKAYKQVASWVKGDYIIFAGVEEIFHILDQAYKDP